MQWLIDIIKQWVIEQGYLTTSYVDRGDPDAYDFYTGDFIRDAALHDLDLSAIIPVGVRAIHFAVLATNTSANRWIWFRKKGNVNPHNRSFIRTQAADVEFSYSDIVEVSSDRKIEYCVQGMSMYKIEFLVRGWFL